MTVSETAKINIESCSHPRREHRGNLVAATVAAQQLQRIAAIVAALPNVHHLEDRRYDSLTGLARTNRVPVCRNHGERTRLSACYARNAGDQRQPILDNLLQLIAITVESKSLIEAAVPV